MKKAYISIPVRFYKLDWVRGVIASMRQNMLTISPSDFQGYNVSIMHNHIKSSDLLVAVGKNNNYIGRGSFEEISLALENKIPTYLISEEFTGMKQIKSVVVKNQKDWNKYAIVELAN